MRNTIEHPMVSIFIPVYNGEKYLAHTLDNVLSQIYREFEVLCVDDSSTDGSFNILQDYAARDSRIRVFRKPNGGDVPHSWTYVIPHIQGDFVLYMSQDDRLRPDTLNMLVQRQQETEADAVIPHEIHYSEGKPMEQLHHLKGIDGDTSQVIDGKEAFRLMIDYSISGRALWSSAIVKKIGMPADTYNADELAQREWALECNKVAFSDAEFLYCQDNPGAITKGLSPRTYDDTLTNALLYKTAANVFPLNTEWLHPLAGKYFHLLYLRMIQYLQQRGNYKTAERRHILSRFNNAYRILHHDIHTNKRRFRLSAAAMPLMWIVAYLSNRKLKANGITLDQELDCYSYTAI